MRHQKRQSKLGGRPRDARRLLLGNLATSIMIHEKIQTTQAKAKAVQPLVDDLINIAKRKEKRLAIRSLNSVLQSELASRKVMEELTKRYAERKSGYTRITPIKFRAGDAAPLVQIELV
ncbi:MAG: 50S ribosomal protein L17 [Candidatus Gracilibacteria bacterium]